MSFSFPRVKIWKKIILTHRSKDVFLKKDSRCNPLRINTYQEFIFIRKKTYFFNGSSGELKMEGIFSIWILFP